MALCCRQGFQWDGKLNGKESVLAQNKSYVTGSNPDVAIMVIADLFGWTFQNERLLSDRYAKEADAKVFIPDFFGGKVIPSEIIRDSSRLAEFDLRGFQKDNDKEIRWPELLSCVKALRSQYTRVGIIDYCYGGWSSFRLGHRSHVPPLVDCISTAHPTWPTKEEIEEIGVPVQILAPEFDPAFSLELKLYANSVIPTRNVPYDYQFFPGVEHGFATRGNPHDEIERRAMVRGKMHK